MAGGVGIARRVGRVGLMTLAFIAPVSPTAPNAPFARFTPVAPVYAQPLPPELTKPVNDFANVIDPVSEAEIERRILELKKASGDVVVVATIDTFQPSYADIQEYAVKMFENHGRGIGDKGKDNGLLVVLALKDRRVKVEVGYDLEQFITDGYATEVSNSMTPYFARGEYGPGVQAGVTALIGRIAQGRGVTLSGVPMPAPESGTGGIQLSPWLIFAIIILFILMNGSGGRRSRMRRGPSPWGGSSWSGWNSGVGPFGGGGRIGGGGFGGGFGGFGGGRSGGGGGGASW